MGAWGFKAWENDGALDWKGDFHRKLRLVPRLKKDIKSKEDRRAAIEWIIRANKADILYDHEIKELAPLAIEKLKETKKRIADPHLWTYGNQREIPAKEMKEIKAAIKKTNTDIDRQIRYMKKFA